MMEHRTVTCSTKVTPTIAKQAEANLNKLGISVSEYLRISLAKAAAGHLQFIDYYFETPEAKQTEQEDKN